MDGPAAAAAAAAAATAVVSWVVPWAPLERRVRCVGSWMPWATLQQHHEHGGIRGDSPCSSRWVMHHVNVNAAAAAGSTWTLGQDAIDSFNEGTGWCATVRSFSAAPLLLTTILALQELKTAPGKLAASLSAETLITS